MQGVSVVGSEIRKNYAAIDAAAASPPVMASPVPVPVAAPVSVPAALPVAPVPVTANVPEQTSVPGQAVATAPGQAIETAGAPYLAPGAAPGPLVSALSRSSCLNQGNHLLVTERMQPLLLVYGWATYLPYDLNDALAKCSPGVSRQQKVTYFQSFLPMNGLHA